MPPPRDPVKLSEYRAKMRRIALERGYGKWMEGKSPTDETRAKLSAAGKRGSVLPPHPVSVKPGRSAPRRPVRAHGWQVGLRYRRPPLALREAVVSPTTSGMATGPTTNAPSVVTPTAHGGTACRANPNATSTMATTGTPTGAQQCSGATTTPAVDAARKAASSMRTTFYGGPPTRPHDTTLTTGSHSARTITLGNIGKTAIEAVANA